MPAKRCSSGASAGGSWTTTEKKLIAYHEAGHALVQGVLDDGHMPVHKVTIIPRGRSLGSTMFIPKKDHPHPRDEAHAEPIATCLGGRDRGGDRAGGHLQRRGGDIKQVTAIARHMVCDWGMSPLGPVAYGDNQDTVFLGRDITRTENL
jgi:cell division protease FtsH